MFGRRVKVTRTAAQPVAPVTRDDIDVPPLDSGRPIIVPDAMSLLTYIDVFEDPEVENVLILSTVLDDVMRQHRGLGARVQKLANDALRKVHVFADNRHRSTAVIRGSHETESDFAVRSLKHTCGWLQSHDPSTGNRFVIAAFDDMAKQRLYGTACDVLLFSDALQELLGQGHRLLDRLASCQAPRMGGASGAEHWPQAQVEAALAAGGLLRGKLRTSEGSCFFGEIRGAFGDLGERVLLPGRDAINRSVHDDVVAVLVDAVPKWKPPAKDMGPPPSDNATDAVKAGYTATGKVVAVIEKNRRPYCGSIDVTQGETAAGMSGSVSVMFQPKSSRIPRIRISTQNVATLKSKRLRVVMDDWPATSTYPVGHYTDVIGEIGDKDTEAQVILLENDIPHYDFSEAVYDCLPKGTWEVEAEEEKKRKDLRHLTVCSVDPLGCRDIDDALHYRELPNGNVEVGVHIADVTHFVQEGSALDIEAQKRSTSVYLVDRRINMLPQLLTENLCSIVGNEDRYAFSAVWEMTPGAEVVSEWFGKTIIRSRAALYYGDAQRMIDDDADNSDLTCSLRGLMKLSRILKKQRDEAGALTLGSQEFKFKIDNDHVNPTDMVQYQTFETNSMIEEWMLFANVAAAKRCYESFPALALLRRHQAPSDRACDDLNAALSARGLPNLNLSTSKALNQSLNACIDPSDKYMNRLVRILTTRCLRQAQYFCSGNLSSDDFLHFGLAMPIYTHFTSPIRRYADVIVHRQLAAITGFGVFSPEKVTTEQVTAIADNINYRHEMAQKAGRDSQNLFTGFFLRKYTEDSIPLEKGYVVRKTEQFVFVMVPSLGQEGRIPSEKVTRSYAPLDQVVVQMRLVREGDVLSAKLQFSIVEDEDGASKRHRQEVE